MDSATLKALKGSIKKWEGIASGVGSDGSVSDCPLCGLYYFSKSCRGCPVQKRTGMTECDGTPYRTDWWPVVREDGRDSPMADTPERKAAARKELDFLKSLLPKPRRKARKAPARKKRRAA